MSVLAKLRHLLRRDPAPAQLVLYSRPRCHLCEEMKAEIARTRVRRHFELREVDVDSDPALAERWGRSIPVLTIGGRLAFKGRATAAEIARKLERFAAEEQS